MTHTRAIAEALLNINAVGFSPRQPIRFKSGILSPVYVDNRKLPYHPQAWHTIIQGFMDVLQANSLGYDLIAGVALGGVPHASALAYALQRPCIMIRPEAKAHGKGQQIEGGEVQAQHVLLVEDLVTTGGSSLSAIHALRQAGAQVHDVVAIVSYGFPEALQTFAEQTLHLHTLVNFSVILEVALAQGRFNQADADLIADWFSAPHSWAERHGLA